MAYFFKAGKKWWLTIRHQGQRKTIDLGEDYNRALTLRRSIETATEEEKFRDRLVQDLRELGLVENNLGPAKSKETVSWDVAVRRVLVHMHQIGRSPRTVSLVEMALKKLQNAFHPETPADITSAVADQWIGLMSQSAPDSKSKGRPLKAGGIHVWIRSASTCFSRWVRWGWIEKNPFFNCDKPKVPLSMPKPIDPQDLEKLLAACNPPLARALRILIHSGMRPDEFINLRWKNVISSGNPRIHIRPDEDWHPKAHTERFIPITKELLKALGIPDEPEKRVAGRNDRGYPLNMDWFQRMFRRAVRRAGLKDKGYTIYSCRDTFATNLAIQGYEAHAIAARLGHRNLQTSMRYVSMGRLTEDRGRNSTAPQRTALPAA